MDRVMERDGRRPDSAQATKAVSAKWATVAAFCASLVGIGLARFAYTPLLPAIVGAHWFDASMAAYLGAANLAGYLVGALAGRPLAARATVPVTLRAMMLVATVAFIACAYPVSFAWFFAWRFLAGLAGGALMVLAAPAVLPHVPASRRGLAGGVIFMGVGIGVAASGTLVPLLLQHGLRDTWLGLGAISLALTAIAWQGWPADTAARPDTPAPAHHRRPPRSGALRALYAEYALNAAGWVPHMIFLVDFVARGLHRGLQVGAEYWVLFGIGATVGPLFAGALADRTGFGRALRIAFVLEIAGVAMPALGLGSSWLIVSSVVVGAFVTGTVPLVLGRVHELLEHHPAQQNSAWRTATVGFALFQAVAAYGLSFVFSHDGGDYRLLFAIGVVAMVLALVIDLAAAFGNRNDGAKERLAPTRADLG
ncbi:YbfB/YjiJ family MFS transporter [Paraburkholderia caballeronis]|uniref:YbfB/YjiJ family MFS transporter n=1 Tax=Paraburkholderia caballeronis TaxID=416943 RepID=UPI0010DAC150|nr:YbfB/YjiJ family MFS transporter [Paraburkholderia caballeronis]TDV13946.1 putative MFS family arabinose efflux permease [Paraburkholderia caballeronis]TDV15459.1 putative MFS family arabinose efflux permease [Paraburkholderia caballeronis]TDV24927.1 putative MFS family arabinose efflux permease [Paraburkholderia caballeronis]